MGTVKFQMPVCLLCTYIEYYVLRLSYLPQISLYFIEISLGSLVQIYQGLLPVQSHQNTYVWDFFCEQLFIDADR